MAKRILVPLDRAESSLSVLDLVGGIARASGATVRLLNVAPIPSERVADNGRVVAYASQEMERVEHSRLDDLKEAEARLDGAPVESVVRFGDPVEEILREADAFGADLIAVSTTRRSWRDRLLGGVADRLLNRADVPVLKLGLR